ncbi:hypothetical protein MK079_05405 [Candidatus Gracilibacteria bacterium]|nr:hypothetical protein [Candidatus Gracilibacteria bacterium]
MTWEADLSGRELHLQERRQNIQVGEHLATGNNQIVYDILDLNNDHEVLKIPVSRSKFTKAIQLIKKRINFIQNTQDVCDFFTQILTSLSYQVSLPTRWSVDRILDGDRENIAFIQTHYGDNLDISLFQAMPLGLSDSGSQLYYEDQKSIHSNPHILAHDVIFHECIERDGTKIFVDFDSYLFHIMKICMNQSVQTGQQFEKVLEAISQGHTGEDFHI